MTTETLETTADDRHIFQPSTPRRGTAVAAMFIAGMFFAAMGIFAKILGTSAAGRFLPASEVSLFRFAFGVLIMLPFHGRRGINLWGHDKRGLILRGITGGVAVYFYFLSLQNTSLTHAVLLNYTSLFFAPLFAVFVLQEKVTRRVGTAILIASCGTIMITRSDGNAHLLGDLYGLISGVMAGAAITEIRRLRQSESPWSVFFYFSLLGIPIAAVPCILQPLVAPTTAGWLLLIGMAAASVGAQMLMTYGYGFVRAAEGTLMTMSQIVYGALVGALWFSEPLTSRTLIGGTLILTASIWLSVFGKGK